MAINVDEGKLDQFLQDGAPEPGSDPDPDPATDPDPNSDPDPATQGSDDDNDSDPDPDSDTFPREYVEKLRRESAGYRDRAKKYQEAFDGYENEAVDEWLQLATTLRADPQAAAGRFQELADAIRDQFGDKAGDAAEKEMGIGDNEDTDSSEDKPLTRAEFDKLMSEKEKESQMKARVAQIETDATALGYEKGSREYKKLLWTASESKTGSIQEAHEALQAEKQAVIDGYVAELKGQGNPKVPTGSTPASTERTIETFDEATTALDEWLASQGA